VALVLATPLHGCMHSLSTRGLGFMLPSTFDVTRVHNNYFAPRHARCRGGGHTSLKCAAVGPRDDFTLAVSTVMGLESVVKQELLGLGYPNARAVGASGRVELRGDSQAIARCNLHLRSATRVMLVLARFPATTFDELFDKTQAIPWKDYIHVGASFPVRGKSVRSTLHSVPACQSIVKKAIIARLLEESGPNFAQDTEGWVQEDDRKGIYGVEVSILKDEVTVSLDTSGDALHRRGYRTGVLENGAPLKETLAASMLLLSKWTPDRPLLDPFCGSGTILLEAALMAHNIAPGLRRSFASEDWPLICDKGDWERLRAEAEERVEVAPKGVRIFGADIDRRAVEMTHEHLRAAGLEGSVQLSVSDIHRLPPPPGESASVALCVRELYGSGLRCPRLRWRARARSRLPPICSP
jgi:putative N6-adenine-specific DNA methylase